MDCDVSLFVMLIFAPTTTAPLGSVIVPFMLPVEIVVCATLSIESVTTKAVTKKNMRGNDIGSSYEPNRNGPTARKNPRSRDIGAGSCFPVRERTLSGVRTTPPENQWRRSSLSNREKI